MGKYHKEIDMFEQFSKGELNKEDRQMMIERLSSDVELKESYEQYKLLVDGVKYTGRKNMLDKIQSWDKQIEVGQSESPKSKQVLFKWYYVAAILGFFIIAFFVVDSTLNSNYDDLVAQHYQPYNYIPETKRGDTPEKNVLEDIFQYYDRGEYVQTIQLINQLDDSQKNSVSFFILANAYQAVEDYENAIKIYQNIVASDGEYTIGAKWYLALCYLSLEKRELALPILEDLKLTNTSYSPKANTLLKDLK